MRKYTYIYDLHENFYSCFDTLELCTPVQFGGDADPKGIQYQLQVRVIYIHEAVQVAWKKINFPFIKCSLDSGSTQSAAPVGIWGGYDASGIFYPLLDDT